MISKCNRVLYYHVIADKLPDIYPQGISINRFEKQLCWLKTLGYTFTPLSESVQNAHHPYTRNVSISIDDGFASVWENLLPLMRKHGLKPTLFLVGKCVDNQALAWNHKLILIKAHVPEHTIDYILSDIHPGVSHSNLFNALSMQEKEAITDTLWQSCMPYTQNEYLHRFQPFLSTKQLTELLESGAEIGLHSFSHPDFSRLSLEEANTEISLCCQTLDSLGLPYQRLFAYPYGRIMNKENNQALIAQNMLLATFGTTYKASDNKAVHTCWQRTGMERETLDNWVEFALKPYFRLLK